MSDLPKGWLIKPLSEIAEYSAGRTPARANEHYWRQTSNRIPWVTISDMTEYETVMQTSQQISELAFREVFRERIVPAGTLLMSFKLTIGRVVTLGVPACHNEAIISIYPSKEVDQSYLGYFLSQVDYANHQDRQIKGNTLNRSKIDKIPVVLPPIEEQRAISRVLDFCRKGIRTEGLAEITSIELKKTTMRELFRRGLYDRPQKETEFGQLPEDWKVVTLGSLGKIGSGTTPNRRKAEYWKGGTTPWITSGRMYERRIDGSDTSVTDIALQESSLPLLKPGAVLIAIVGQGKTLGHCAILDVEATVSRHVGFIQINEASVSPEYIRSFLESQYSYLRQLASGNGSTRGALTCAILRNLKVPVPSLEEQEEFVKVLDAIDKKIELHKSKRISIEQFFQSLMNQLMTGKIRVNELQLSAIPTTKEASV